MKSYVPHLFISIGETNAYFTLRESYMHEQWVGGQDGYMDRSERSYHLFNLSQDADAAIAKAQEYAGEVGLKLNANADTLKWEMRDIARANAEQLQRRKDRLAEQEREWAEMRATRDAENREQIEKGIIPFGTYKDWAFRELPVSYLNWLMDKAEAGEFEADSLMCLIGLTAIRLCPDLRLPRPVKDLHVGTEGKRMTFDVTVIRCISFQKQGFGWRGQMETAYITTMVTNDGACLVSFSGSFAAEAGEVLKIKATIKEHSEYKGQAQTVVQRVKEIKVIHTEE